MSKLNVYCGFFDHNKRKPVNYSYNLYKYLCFILIVTSWHPIKELYCISNGQNDFVKAIFITSSQNYLVNSRSVFFAKLFELQNYPYCFLKSNSDPIKTNQKGVLIFVLAL